MKLSSHKTYILPSPVGIGLISITFLVFIIAITFGHPFSYFITFFLVSIIVVCAFSTNSAISKLKTFHFHDEYIESEAEDVFYANLSAHEVTAPMALHVVLENESTDKLSAISKESSKIKFYLRSGSCGVNKMPRLRISTSYPLGIFKAWKYIESNKKIITYPRRVRGTNSYRESSLKSGSDREHVEYLDTKDEFLDHRKFRDTDSWKHIDWKAFARGRGLLTKNFSGQESNVLLLEVKKNDSLTYLGQVTDELFRRYSLGENTVFLVNGDEFSRGSNRTHLLKCLRILSQMGEKCE